MSHHVSEYPGPVLNGEVYELMDSTDRTRTPASQLPTRVWSEEMKAQATQYIPRADTRPSDIPEEWVTTWDDWSRGLTSDETNTPGCLYLASGLTGIQPGALTTGGAFDGVTDTYASTNEEGLDGASLIFNGQVFVIKGRLVYQYANGVETLDKDFGTGVLATDAIVHNSELIVGFGGLTNKIQKRITSGTWSTATDAVYADHFARVQNRLWRVTATNLVSNIATTDNPFTLSNWPTGISVGDPSTGVTDLNGQGERVLVSKPEGLFPGDAGAVFENALPQLLNSLDPDNGRQTLVVGGDVYFPHSGGFIHYDGSSAEEVGLQETFWAQPNAVDIIPGNRIRALAAAGEYLWAATGGEPGHPLIAPTKVLTTTDAGDNYTDQTAAVTANDVSTYASIGALDTIANGDWILVGYSASAFGLIAMEFLIPDSNARTLVPQYWNGAWTAMPASAGFIDGTSAPPLSAPQPRLRLGAATFSRSGTLQFRSTNLTDWVATSINGTSAFWIRLGVSGALATTVRLNEVRISVAAADPTIFYFRGRHRRQGDPAGPTILWEYYTAGLGAQTLSMLYTTGVAYYPHWIPDVLLVVSPQRTQRFSVQSSFSNNSLRLRGGTGTATFARHDGGYPETNKQYLSGILKAVGISATAPCGLEYRLEGSTTWVTISASITSSPYAFTLTAITGRSIQFRLSLVAHTTVPQAQITHLEVRFRLLPTVKRVWSYVLKLQRGQRTEVDVQMTNLEALVGAAAVTHIDPLRRTSLPSVNVLSMGASELYTDGNGLPALAVPITCADV